MLSAFIDRKAQSQIAVLSGLAALALVTACLCFALALTSDGQGQTGGVAAPLPAVSPTTTPVSVPRVSPWLRLAEMRRTLNTTAPKPKPEALTAMIATADSIIASKPDAAVAESANQLKAECWTRLGDKQAALDALIAQIDQVATEDREAAAWRLVRSARRESRQRGAFLATQQLDEFFAHFSDTRADDAALLLAAQVHQELGDREAAIGFYRTHLTRHPASPMREFTSLCLASLYEGKRDPERAAAIRADWDAEQIRRANAPAPQQPPMPAPATLKPCTACGS